MRRTWKRLPEAALILTLGALACSGGRDNAAKASQPAGTLPPGHPTVASMQTAHAPVAVVAETMDAGGYTYARLTGPDGTDVWAAGPETKLAVGDSVVMVAPMIMTDFTSKTLHRTFHKIYFASAFQTPAEAAAPAQAAPSTGPAGIASAGVTKGTGVVQETMDAGGYTYLRVMAGDSLVWLAAPPTKVAKGATVSWSSSMAMQDFTSRTLKRTFDKIYFVERVEVGS